MPIAFRDKAVSTKSTFRQEDLSRKDAKAQSAIAFLKVFFAAFASLREKYFYSELRIYVG